MLMPGWRRLCSHLARREPCWAWPRQSGGDRLDQGGAGGIARVVPLRRIQRPLSRPLRLIGQAARKARELAGGGRESSAWWATRPGDIEAARANFLP